MSNWLHSAISTESCLRKCCLPPVSTAPCAGACSTVVRASRDRGQPTFHVPSLIQVDVDQFYGIEIEEFPAQIAQVALWLMDHQMNVRVSEEFGMYFARIPLKTSPHIVHGNALTLDWNDVLPAERASY